MASGIWSIHSDLPRVRSISEPAIPFVVPIDLYAFQAAVLNRNARRATYPVHLVVSRETATSHRLGTTRAQVRLRYARCAVLFVR